MMLYSLIDGRLIRLQGGPKTEKENLESAKKTKRKLARYSGAAAVNRINNKYNEVHEDDIKVWFFSNLTRENLFVHWQCFMLTEMISRSSLPL